MMSSYLMQAGQWSLELDPATPMNIRQKFASMVPVSAWWMSFVFFTEVDIIAEFTKDDIAARAIFTGPVWERGGKLTRFGGPDLFGMMGNDRASAGNGSYPASDFPTFPATISQVIASWFGTNGDYSNGIRTGTSYSPTTTQVRDLDVQTYVPPLKPKLDELMAQTGNEYRITPAGRIDWGIASSLFVSTPEVLLAEETVGPIPGIKIPWIDAGGIDVSENIYGLRNWAAARSSVGGVSNSSGSGTAAARFYAPSPALALFASPVVDIDSPSGFDAADAAGAIAQAYALADRGITITAKGCILADITPGDYVYAYSPLDGIESPTQNQLSVDGTVIHPETVRAVGVTQPFIDGMGAYVAVYDGIANTFEVTRITDYVIPEEDGATVEIGARPTPPVPPRIAAFIDL